MPIKITLIFFKSYSSENNYYQKKVTPNAGKCVWERGPHIHCWWECQLVRPLWKSMGSSSNI